MAPRIKKMEFDGENKGSLLNMQVDCSDNYLITSFENGSVSIFDFKIGEIINELPPMQRCMINETLMSAQLLIDDQCTFLAYLGSDQKQVTFYTIDWDVKVKKLEKPPNASQVKIFNKKINIADKLRTGVESV